MITLTCDNCDKPFEVEEDAQTGEKVSCPYCGDINRVPAAAGRSAGAAVQRGVPVSGASPAAADAASAPRRRGDDSERPVRIIRQAMFRAHPFWFMLMLLLIVGGLSLAAVSTQLPQPRISLWTGLVAATIGAVWWLIWWAAPHRWVKLIITTKRTIRQEGIIVRKTSEVLHTHIRNVKIEQTVLQRLFGVGSIAIDSAGGEAEQMIEIEMNNVAKPYDVKAVIDQYRGI